MSYNWQNGEVITAEKLNNTGGAGGNGLFIINCYYDDNDNIVLDKTVDEMVDAVQGDIVPVLLDDNDCFYYLASYYITQPYFLFVKYTYEHVGEEAESGAEDAQIYLESYSVSKENDSTIVEYDAAYTPRPNYGTVVYFRDIEGSLNYTDGNNLNLLGEDAVTYMLDCVWGKNNCIPVLIYGGPMLSPNQDWYYPYTLTGSEIIMKTVNGDKTISIARSTGQVTRYRSPIIKRFTVVNETATPKVLKCTVFNENSTGTAAYNELLDSINKDSEIPILYYGKTSTNINDYYDAYYYSGVIQAGSSGSTYVKIIMRTLDGKQGEVDRTGEVVFTSNSAV